MVVKVEKPVNCSVVGDAMIGKSDMVKAFLDRTKPDSAYVATTIETYEGRHLFYLFTYLFFFRVINFKFILVKRNLRI